MGAQYQICVYTKFSYIEDPTSRSILYTPGAAPTSSWLLHGPAARKGWAVLAPKPRSYSTGLRVGSFGVGAMNRKY